MLGLVLGGTVVGTLAGAAGTPILLAPEWPRWALLGGCVAVVTAFELYGRPLRLPQNARAVPQDIISRHDIDGPLQFGFEMGTGLRTFMPSSVPHLLLLSVLLVGGLIPGIVAGTGFGAGRVLMPFLRARYRPPGDWDHALARWARWHFAACGTTFTLLLTALALHGG